MYLQVKNDDVMMMMIDDTNINNTHQLLKESCTPEQNKTSPVCKTYPKPDHQPVGHPSCPSLNQSCLWPASLPPPLPPAQPMLHMPATQIVFKCKLGLAQMLNIVPYHLE